MINFVCTKTEQGGREYQEDRFLNEKIHKNGRTVAFFSGIFDGHGGDSISTLAQANFSKILEQGIKDLNQTEFGSIVKNSFFIVDELALLNKTPHQGSTVAFSLVTKNTVWFANAGDSMTIIGFKDGSFKAMSYEHKVENEEERIRENGGLVMNLHGVKRLFGNLNLSRSVGDHEYKRWIICNPHIRSISGKHKDEIKYIFTASDGIWDVMSFDFVNEFINKMKPTTKTIEIALNVLIKKAMSMGSTDNITCTYIELNS